MKQSQMLVNSAEFKTPIQHQSLKGSLIFGYVAAGA